MSFREIRIDNLGVIDQATIEPSPGLTVISGETGAGKTMLLTGLALIMGAKAEPATVRNGANRAVVEGRLAVDDASIIDRALDAGAELDEDGTLLLARSVAAEGRSRAFLGGRTVPQSLLGEISADLVTVHGQSDQIRLRTASRQRAALDAFGGEVVNKTLVKYRQSWDQWLALDRELQTLIETRTQRVAEAEVLGSDLDEIAAAELEENEDTNLKSTVARLTHSEDLQLAADTAREALTSGAATEAVAAAELAEVARTALSQGAVHDEVLAEYAERAQEIGYLASDLSTDLASYATAIDTDPNQLAQAHERLSFVTGLLRKHHVESVAELVDWEEKARHRFSLLQSDTTRIDELKEALQKQTQILEGLAEELSQHRTQAGKSLAKAVTAELHGLAMPDARFEVSITPTALNLNGRDDITFLLTPHAAAPPRPLGQGASGGELSRVMLALEVALAQQRGVEDRTFVFDEVDAGVGGQAAIEIGRRLARLSRSSQVLVVTHLAQVAAFADQHLVVRKGEKNTTSVNVVDDMERVKELARMLSGQVESSTAQQHAAELLGLATSARESWDDQR